MSEHWWGMHHHESTRCTISCPIAQWVPFTTSSTNSPPLPMSMSCFGVLAQLLQWLCVLSGLMFRLSGLWCAQHFGWEHLLQRQIQPEPTTQQDGTALCLGCLRWQWGQYTAPNGDGCGCAGCHPNSARSINGWAGPGPICCHLGPILQLQILRLAWFKLYILQGVFHRMIWVACVPFCSNKNPFHWALCQVTGAFAWPCVCACLCACVCVCVLAFPVRCAELQSKRALCKLHHSQCCFAMLETPDGCCIAVAQFNDTIHLSQAGNLLPRIMTSQFVNI